MGEIERLDALTPDPRNRRKHPARNLGMLGDSLRDVGASRSIVIDEHGEILAGNGLVAAAKAAGLSRVEIVEGDGETVIAVRRRGLSDEQKRALALYDNRSAELAEWDWSQLGADHAAGLTLEPWFSREELGEAFDTPRAGQTDPEAVPAMRPTGIALGEVFALGAHRLVCGDSLDAATRDRVLDGRLVDFAWADPPYGIAMDDDAAARRVGFYGGTAIAKSDLPWDARLVGDWIPLWEAVVRPGGYLGSWSPYQGIGTIERHALACGLVWLNLFSWVKENPAPGFPEYLAKSCEHSSIYRKPGSGRYVGPALVRDYAITPTTPQAERFGHPTPKRVDVLGPIVSKLVAPEGLVADPFCGVGSLLIACEQLGRVSVNVEIDPVFCQATIDRWEQFTERKAEKRGEVSA